MDVNIVGSLVKVALTFGLLFLTLKLVGRFGGGVQAARRRGGGQPVRVVSRTTLGKSASMVVVQLGERCLALGVTDQQINVLADVPELKPDDSEVRISLNVEPAGTPAPTPAPSWKDLVEGIRERTVRH